MTLKNTDEVVAKFDPTDPSTPISQMLPRAVERGSLIDAIDWRARQIANVHVDQTQEIAAIELMVASIRRAMLFLDEEEIRTALLEIGEAVNEPWTLIDLYLRIGHAFGQTPTEQL